MFGGGNDSVTPASPCDVGQFDTISRYEDLAATDLVAESTYVYDDNGQLTNLDHEKGMASFADDGWSYDDAGRITQYTSDDDAVFTPALTLWAFLSQVLHKAEQRSCVAAVARVITLLVASGLKACSEDTGAYCRARAKLSETVLERLTTDVARGCETELPRKWLWRGRHVHLVDGTTVSMPDTEENQEAYPQHTAQKPGLGFPIARLLNV